MTDTYRPGRQSSRWLDGDCPPEPAPDAPGPWVVRTFLREVETGPFDTFAVAERESLRLGAEGWRGVHVAGPGWNDRWG